MSLDDYKLPDGSIDATRIPGPSDVTLPPSITLRDYFAAMAMQGSLAAFTMSGALDAFTSEGYKADPTGGDRDGFAQWCYVIADALLAERAK